MAVVSTLVCQLLVNALRQHTRRGLQLLVQHLTDHFASSWLWFLCFSFHIFYACFPLFPAGGLKYAERVLL